MGTGQAAGELRLLESLAVSAVRHGSKIDDATKAELRSLLNNELDTAENQIKAAHAADVTEGGDILTSYDTHCKTPFTSSQNTMNNALNKQTGSVGLKEQAQRQCRVTLEDEDGDRDTKCAALDAFLNMLRAEGPAALTVPSTRTGMADWWVRLKAFAAHYDQWYLLDKACREAEDQALVTRLNECKTKQSSFETDICSVRLAGHLGWTSYEQCREQSTADLLAANTDGAAGEASRKVEWEAIQKIRCFANLLLNENGEKQADGSDKLTEEELNKCKNLVTDTTHLDLVPSVLPAPGVYDMSGLDVYGGYPCTAGFVDTNYANLFKVETCQPCDDFPGTVPIKPSTRVKLTNPATGQSFSWFNECGGTNDAWQLGLCNGASCTTSGNLGGSWTLTEDTAIQSGAVVSWYNSAVQHVADCAGGSCTAQPFPIPGGHWGSPYRVWKVDNNGQRIEGGDLHVGDRVVFARMYHGLWNGHHMMSLQNCGSVGTLTRMEDMGTSWEDFVIVLGAVE